MSSNWHSQGALPLPARRQRRAARRAALPPRPQLVVPSVTLRLRWGVVRRVPRLRHPHNQKVKVRHEPHLTQLIRLFDPWVFHVTATTELNCLLFGVTRLTARMSCEMRFPLSR